MRNTACTTLIATTFVMVVFMIYFERRYLDNLIFISHQERSDFPQMYTNVLDRDRNKNGKLLTESELALMREVDQYSKLPENEIFVTANQQNTITRAIQMRRKKGVPTPVILKWSVRKIDMNRSNLLLGAECGGCLVTTDRNALNRSVAVSFFFKRQAELPDPRYRRSDQAYVFRSVETPSKCLRDRKFFDGTKLDSMFNLTLNYRRDSDVRIYFGNTAQALRQNRKIIGEDSLEEKLRTKTRMAVWYCSNCYRTPGARKRMKYVMAMVKAGLKLNKFGECFPEQKERVPGNPAIYSGSYKFYIAFENSIHCPDYVTEKFWRNSFEGLMVPVVFGPTKADVETVAPKNSYIHVEDFSSPAEVVRYLHYLDSNFTAYLEYHKWRYTPIDGTTPNEYYARYATASWCRLCKRQVLENHPPKTIPSVMEWMFEKEYVDDECLQAWNNVRKVEVEEMRRFFASPNFYSDSVLKT